MVMSPRNVHVVFEAVCSWTICQRCQMCLHIIDGYLTCFHCASQIALLIHGNGILGAGVENVIVYVRKQRLLFQGIVYFFV